MNRTRITGTLTRSDYEARVDERSVAGGTYLLLPAPVESVVSFRGSYLSCPAFERGEALVRDLAVSLFDKGTKSHSKFEMAELLEDRGAQISITSDGVRVRVFGRALREDIPLVLSLLGEQLREPSFLADEFELVKERFIAALRRSLVDTGALASGALCRRLYHEAHPNFIPRAEDELEQLSGITVEEVKDYFSRNRQMIDWRLALVGDLDWGEVASAATQAFETANPTTMDLSFPVDKSSIDPGREAIYVADKENIDVQFGHIVPIIRVDESYLPLYIGSYILGGNFSARLMSIIRDRMGLTYGIHCGLSGFTAEHHGTWGISVTLSRDNLDKGVEATMEEIRRFADSGVTQQELDEKKTTMTGSFKVGLSTTGALAGTLLRNAERGRDAGFLDTYPDMVRSVALDDVNGNIARFFEPDALHVTMAGSINE